jgi:hypothetical protein
VTVAWKGPKLVTHAGACVDVTVWVCVAVVVIDAIFITVVPVGKVSDAMLVAVLEIVAVTERTMVWTLERVDWMDETGVY